MSVPNNFVFSLSSFFFLELFSEDICYGNGGGRSYIEEGAGNMAWRIKGYERKGGLND